MSGILAQQGNPASSRRLGPARRPRLAVLEGADARVHCRAGDRSRSQAVLRAELTLACRRSRRTCSSRYLPSAITCSSSIQTSQSRVSTSTCVRRLPVGVRLAAVGIAEREVHAGHLLVLQQDADHLAQAEVGAERQLADAVAVLVGVAVVPEVVLEIARARTRADTAGRRESPASAASRRGCRTWR